MTCAENQYRERGLTLIELVVAITILGILTTVLFSGLRTGLRAWSRGSAEIDDVRSTQAGLSLLRGQIQGALPVLFFPGSEGPQSVSFSGDRYRLRLITRSSFRDGPSAPPRWAELVWQPSADSGRLTLKESPVLSPSNAPGSEALWQGVVLEAKEFRFEYLPRRTPEQTTGWVDAWSGTGLQMPAAVRVSYERRGRRYQMVLPLEYAENSWNGLWSQ